MQRRALIFQCPSPSPVLFSSIMSAASTSTLRSVLALSLLAASIVHLFSPRATLPALGTPHARAVASAATAVTAPFSLGPVDARNTAYSMILVGPRLRRLYAVYAAFGLRRVDPARDILLFIKEHEPLDPDLQVVMDQLRVTVRRVGRHVDTKMEWDFGHCCGEFWGCWLKLLVWNETSYKAVMNIDTDFLALRSPGPDIFDFVARHATSPFDVGGVADPVVAASHPETHISDVFNGGMFVALPSAAAFSRIVTHAHSTAWRWGEMLWLNTFATTYGKWVRLPSRYNAFPMTMGSGSMLLFYNPINWGALTGLHFSGHSKVTPDTTENDCRRRERDCVECCVKWTQLGTAVKELLAANEALHEAVKKGGEDAAKAEIARLKAALPQDPASQTLGVAVGLRGPQPVPNKA